MRPARACSSRDGTGRFPWLGSMPCLASRSRRCASARPVTGRTWVFDGRARGQHSRKPARPHGSLPPRWRGPLAGQEAGASLSGPHGLVVLAPRDPGPRSGPPLPPASRAGAGPSSRRPGPRPGCGPALAGGPARSAGIGCPVYRVVWLDGQPGAGQDRAGGGRAGPAQPRHDLVRGEPASGRPWPHRRRHVLAVRPGCLGPGQRRARTPPSRWRWPRRTARRSRCTPRRNACSCTAVSASPGSIPAHLYLKRAKADSIAFGTPDAHRAALASLVNLPRGDPGRVRHGAQPAVIRKRLNHTDAAPSTPITRPSSHAGSGARSRATGTLSSTAGSRKRGLEPR